MIDELRIFDDDSRPFLLLLQQNNIGHNSGAVQYNNRVYLTKNRDRGMRVDSHPHALHNTH